MIRKILGIATLLFWGVMMASCSSDDDNSLKYPSETNIYGVNVPVQIISLREMPSWLARGAEKGEYSKIFQGEYQDKTVYILISSFWSSPHLQAYYKDHTAVEYDQSEKDCDEKFVQSLNNLRCIYINKMELIE